MKPWALESIQQRFSVPRVARDPLARLLANIDGDASPALLQTLEQRGREASVLLTLLERPSGLTVLFTERAAHLKDHAGQISFPGGRIAVGETPVAAALREANEEVGLQATDVTVLGSLDVLLTGTGFCITPVVGFVARRAFTPAPNPEEVASVFEVPLEFILEPTNLVTSVLERHGTRLRTYELHYGGHRIWGATAAMLRNFTEVLFDEKT
jgi:8-oxo-dGTP pyrophosphatase MutT (NUDIX family)